MAAETESRKCDFCGEGVERVGLLLAGQGANICDACIRHGFETLRERDSKKTFRFAFERIESHIAPLAMTELVSSSRSFPLRVRADLQAAVDDLLTARADHQVGVANPQSHAPVTLSTLLNVGSRSRLISPLQFEEVDIGEAAPVRCLRDAVWLLREDGVPAVALLSCYNSMRGPDLLRLEFAVPPGEAGSRLTRNYFDGIERAVNKARAYRGKVLSLEQSDPYSGFSKGLAVHKLAPVPREQLVLPERTLRQLERNILDFAGRRGELRDLGLPTKKGLLFHGPPGTGKTHTVNYLASRLADHTTLVVTGEQVCLLDEYFALARLLQPAILVVEDVDLIARDRGDMQSPWEQLQLNRLLNEMDGLREDAEVFFVLTTNRPESIEGALADRPGRIDQAIEFPLPDAAGRAKLIALYAAGLKVPAEVEKRLVARTEGASAAFIKEMMRRGAQMNLEAGSSGDLTVGDMDEALEDMLFGGGQLNRRLLGGAALEDPAP